MPRASGETKQNTAGHVAAFCNEDENDRDLWIDAAVLAYNLSLQESPHNVSL